MPDCPSSRNRPAPAPTRRRFRWSLRTMFVVVTVFCCWLGYEVNWIRQRHQFLDDQEQLIQGSMTYAPGTNVTCAPGLLWMFGEKGRIDVMVITEGPTREKLNSRDSALLDAAKQLFPEAGIAAGPDVYHQWQQFPVPHR